MKIGNEPLHDWRGDISWLPGLQVRVMGQLQLFARPYRAWQTILSVRARLPDGRAWIFTNVYEPGELTEEYLLEVCSDPHHPFSEALSERMTRAGVTRKVQS